jgi:lycopene elongase/hydratase (dihydrobisanhydrobacterioruberin-forming)
VTAEVRIAQENDVPAQNKIKAILRLTRWREHVAFTIPLTIIGGMLASHLKGITPDARLMLVTIANILAMCFAFMVNDVVDAPDDAMNPRKKQRNPVSNGTLSTFEANLATYGTMAVAFVLYVLAGGWALWIGALTLALCYFYSVPPLRLKARPVTDVVSHALMLSGLLVMTGYFTYDLAPGIAWAVIAAAIAFSAGGQFYNQIDDYEVDKAAGLKNTVVLLGKRGTMLLMYGCQLGAVGFIALAIFGGAFPSWLGVVLVITAFVCTLFTWDTDMRGNAADAAGKIQKPALFVANMVALLWMAQVLGWL